MTFNTGVLVVVAVACALLGGHAITTRTWRWGHRATMLYRGASGVLRGVAMLIVATAFIIAAIVESRTQGYLVSSAWMSNPITAILGGSIVALWGSATVIDRASDERKPFFVTLPARVVGGICAVIGIGAIIWGVENLFRAHP
jgi:hypothetical protein